MSRAIAFVAEPLSERKDWSAILAEPLTNANISASITAVGGQKNNRPKAEYGYERLDLKHITNGGRKSSLSPCSKEGNLWQ